MVAFIVLFILLHAIMCGRHSAGQAFVLMFRSWSTCRTVRSRFSLIFCEILVLSTFAHKDVLVHSLFHIVNSLASIRFFIIGARRPPFLKSFWNVAYLGTIRDLVFIHSEIIPLISAMCLRLGFKI